MATVTLQPFANYSGAEHPVVILVALLVCLIPTTIGGLLSAIGIAGMDRLVQRNVLAMSGRAVEAAGDVTTLLLDKTGTITYGARQAAELLPVHGVDGDRARRGRAGVEPGRRDAGGPLDRRVRRRAVTASTEPTLPGAAMVAVHRPDPDERDGLPGRRRSGPAVRCARAPPRRVERMVEAERWHRAARGAARSSSRSRATAPRRSSSPTAATARRRASSA